MMKFAVLLVVACVGLVEAAHFNMTNDAPEVKCELFDEEPSVVFGNRMPTANNKNLAEVIAYAIYNVDKKGLKHKYMPMMLRDLQVDEMESGHKVTMDLTCATVSFVVLDGRPEPVHAALMRINYMVPNMGVVDCTIDNVGEIISYDSGKHYACNGPVLECRVSEGDYLTQTLKFTWMEFEVNGDPGEIKDGHFSTPLQECRTASLGNNH